MTNSLVWSGGALAAVFLAAACSGDSGTTSAPTDSSGNGDGAALEVARALFEAWNAHSPDDMALVVTDDFELFYVGEDGRAALSVTGPEALRTEMEAYFEQRPEVRSRMVESVGGERFVAFREQIAGGASSLAVFEILGQRVRRAWYYPAESGVQ
ncbi:MAG: nuclear transport factor 2 family protein [Gemmatimonadetes bacterium]|nr:nuclear transport factor 2 family protein [Gemmatimonadota bacterium]